MGEWRGFTVYGLRFTDMRRQALYAATKLYSLELSSMKLKQVLVMSGGQKVRDADTDKHTETETDRHTHTHTHTHTRQGKTPTQHSTCHNVETLNPKP